MASLTSTGATLLSFDSALGSHMVLQQSPARAAIYGEVVTAPDSMPPLVSVQLQRMPDSHDQRHGGGVLQSVTVTANATGAGVSTKLPSKRRWEWRAHLDPVAGGASTFMIEASVRNGPSANLTHLLFGDVWVCAGQSNMQLPLFQTYGMRDSARSVKKGQYSNIRLSTYKLFADNAQRKKEPAQWLSAHASLNDGPQSTFELFCATCWHFAEALTERFVAARLRPPSLGLVCIAQGASPIEWWAPKGKLSESCRHTLSEGGEGSLYQDRVLPLTRMPIRGWLWYQGEHNLKTNAVSGNSLGSYGYGCELPAMVALWRAAWSAVPNTTDPLAPFGVVTLSPSAGWSGANDYGGMRWSQTANYGRLPNPAMPHTFLAHAYDLPDPYSSIHSLCYFARCCGPQFGSCEHNRCAEAGREDARKCNETLAGRGGREACLGYCTALGRTPINTASFGGLHSRLKKPIGERLATAALRTVYGVGHNSAEGPTIAGCRVLWGSLVLKFDESLLSGETVVLQPPRYAEGSMLQVLVDDSQFCLQRMVTCNASFSSSGKDEPPPTTCGPTQREWFCPHALTAAGVDSPYHEKRLRDMSPVRGPQLSSLPNFPRLDGWRTLNMTRISPFEIAVDLSPLGGASIHAVRYAWGERPGNDMDEPLCCASPRLKDNLAALPDSCPPASCPIMASGGLPANPFLARIDKGKCKCISPQVCDE